MKMDMTSLRSSADNVLFLILPFLLSVLFLFFGNIRKKSTGGSKFPPSPHGLPIVGHIFSLDSKKPHISLANMARSMGPLLSLRFGSTTVVVVSSSEAAREVFKFHDPELSGRPISQIYRRIPGMDNSIIAMAPEYNERLRYLRNICHTQLFSSQALESQSHLRMEKVRQMLQFLSSQDGKVVRIAHVILATMVNTLSNAMISQDIIRDFENVEEVESYMRRLLRIGIPSLGDLCPWLAFLDFGINRKANDYIKLCRSLWGDVLKERKGRGQDASGERIPDFLDFLIKSSWDEMQIFNILTEFLASAESMTTATEWAIVELTRNQGALVKLRKELDEATAEGMLIREHDLGKMPYLQACLKETLRLHPPSPFLVPRVAVETCKLMDFDIPRGCLVVTNAYALGRDPMTWEDPLSFKPERFIGKRIDVTGTNYEVLPFGGGRRICLGRPLALKQMQLVLGSIVSAFDWSIPGENDPSKIDMSEEFSITLRKEIPMVLIPKKRSDFKIE